MALSLLLSRFCHDFICSVVPEWGCLVIFALSLPLLLEDYSRMLWSCLFRWCGLWPSRHLLWVPLGKRLFRYPILTISYPTTFQLWISAVLLLSIQKFAGGSGIGSRLLITGIHEGHLWPVPNLHETGHWFQLRAVWDRDPRAWKVGNLQRLYVDCNATIVLIFLIFINENLVTMVILGFLFHSYAKCWVFSDVLLLPASRQPSRRVIVRTAVFWIRMTSIKWPGIAMDPSGTAPSAERWVFFMP